MLGWKSQSNRLIRNDLKKEKVGLRPASRHQALKVDWLGVTICITMVSCDWWVSIVTVPVRSCFLGRQL